MHGINALGWPQREVSPSKSVIGLYQCPVGGRFLEPRENPCLSKKMLGLLGQVGSHSCHRSDCGLQYILSINTFMVVQHRIHLASSMLTRFLMKNQSTQEEFAVADFLHDMPGIDASRFPRYHGTFAWSWWTCWFAEIAAKESNTELAQERSAQSPWIPMVK